MWRGIKDINAVRGFGLGFSNRNFLSKTSYELLVCTKLSISTMKSEMHAVAKSEIQFFYKNQGLEKLNKYPKFLDFLFLWNIDILISDVFFNRKCWFIRNLAEDRNTENFFLNTEEFLQINEVIKTMSE